MRLPFILMALKSTFALFFTDDSESDGVCRWSPMNHLSAVLFKPFGELTEEKSLVSKVHIKKESTTCTNLSSRTPAPSWPSFLDYRRHHRKYQIASPTVERTMAAEGFTLIQLKVPFNGPGPLSSQSRPNSTFAHLIFSPDWTRFYNSLFPSPFPLLFRYCTLFGRERCASTVSTKDLSLLCIWSIQNLGIDQAWSDWYTILMRHGTIVISSMKIPQPTTSVSPCWWLILCSPIVMLKCHPPVIAFINAKGNLYLIIFTCQVRTQTPCIVFYLRMFESRIRLYRQFSSCWFTNNSFKRNDIMITPPWSAGYRLLFNFPVLCLLKPKSLQASFCNIKDSMHDRRRVEKNDIRLVSILSLIMIGSVPRMCLPILSRWLYQDYKLFGRRLHMRSNSSSLLWFCCMHLVSLVVVALMYKVGENLKFYDMCFLVSQSSKGCKLGSTSLFPCRTGYKFCVELLNLHGLWFHAREDPPALLRFITYHLRSPEIASSTAMRYVHSTSLLCGLVSHSTLRGCDYGHDCALVVKHSPNKNSFTKLIHLASFI